MSSTLLFGCVAVSHFWSCPSSCVGKSGSYSVTNKIARVRAEISNMLALVYELTESVYAVHFHKVIFLQINQGKDTVLLYCFRY